MKNCQHADYEIHHWGIVCIDCGEVELADPRFVGDDE